VSDHGREITLLHLVASTGRTATSFIAACFDQLPGIAACHEGHQGNDDGPDLLPLVNLENFQVFRDPSSGASVVEKKRSRDIIQASQRAAKADVVVDVAYYNAVLGEPILASHEDSLMVGIIRDCESFVRSVTWVSGTDPMPVGWPDPHKELSTRERFISMGRIRPTTGPDHESWSGWGAIERNIWLWRETNARLCEAKERYPERVTVLDFASAEQAMLPFLGDVLDGLAMPQNADATASLASAVRTASDRTNQRSGGYQIPEHTQWSEAQQEMLQQATAHIERRINSWTQ
jgi:hypothetical protein